MMRYVTRVAPRSAVSLKDFDPSHTGGVTRSEADALRAKLTQRLGEQQEMLYAAGTHAVLIVLQGTDTSGKDGTIRQVMSAVNPQGCHVTSFQSPTRVELEHDFLWRIHAAAPAKRMIGIFNRSHYEDVLIVRVHGLQPESAWRRYYDHINSFERLLVDSGTIVLKFFLHISKQEQGERLADRERERDKRWKISVGDYRDRERWADYQAAYEAVLSRCSTEHAPWHIVPADRKWFRNLAVAEAVVSALAPYETQWQQDLLARGERAYQELLDFRAANGRSG
jgi:PPK2 family polyphosphate:nucleotide phosphotransferase